MTVEGNWKYLKVQEREFFGSEDVTEIRGTHEIEVGVYIVQNKAVTSQECVLVGVKIERMKNMVENVSFYCLVEERK